MAQLDEIVGKQNIDQVIQLDKELTKLDETFMKVLKSAKETGTALNTQTATYAGLRKVQEETINQTTKLTEAEKEQQNIAKQTEKTLIKIQSVRAGNTKELEKEKKTLAEVTRETRLNVVATEALRGSYNQISAALSINVAKYKALSQAERENSVEGKKLGQTIAQQQKELKKLDAQMGNHQRNVGNYSSALKGTASSLLGAFGVVGGVVAFASVLKNAYGTMRDFEKAQSNLAAVSLVTKDEIKELTDQALRLGSTTQFTAIEVTELQTELSKLGFSKDEILASSKAVLNLASALDANLADAASVTGAAIRAFGLSAADADDVTATLAVGAAKSALAFEDFETIISTVGPVANAFGFQIEDVVALLGKLRDSGFDASSAATATRNILLNLADSGGKLAKALGKPATTLPELVEGLKTLDARGVSLAETLELTDKRSVAAFNTFLEAGDATIVLRDGVTGVKDELQKMVDIQLDNVAGDVKLLSSAWEGFVLSIEKGDGGIAKFVRGTLQLLTGALAELSNLDLIFKRSSKYTAEQWERAFDFIQNAGLNTNKEFKGLVQEFDGILNEDLENKKAYFIEQARDADLSRVEAEGFWNVYIGRRKEQAKIDAQADADKLKRQQEDAEKAIKIKENEAKKLDEIEAEKGAKAGKKVDEMFEKQQVGMRNELQKTIKELSKTDELIEEAFDIPDPEKELDPWITALEETQQMARDAFIGTEQEQKKALEKQLENLEKYHELGLIGEQEYQAAVTLIEDQQSQKRLDDNLVRLQAAGMVGEALATVAQTYSDIEINRLEKQKDHELQLAGDNAVEKEKIEKKYEDKLKASKRRQAIIEKTMATFKAAINFAQAIMVALTGGPPPFNLVLAAITAALAGIQMVAIAAQPIPQFFKGTQSAPDGLISVGEKGRELIQTRSGNLLMAKDRTITAGLKGARIFSNAETEAIMSRGGGYDSPELRRTLERNNDKLIETIKNKRETYIDMRSGRITERDPSNNYLRTYLNKKTGR